jgi:hypothetical protein
MKRLFALLAVVALFPIAALAQDAPPPPPPPGGPAPSAAKRAEFAQWREHAEEMHRKIRAQVLSVLTPGQRTLLAQIVGSLAVAVVPDEDGAVRRLDATLETSQKQAIIQAVQAGRREMRAAMPPHPVFSPGTELRHTQPFRHRREPPDAGSILLNLALQFGKMHDGPWMHHHPGPAPEATHDSQ